MKRYNKLYICIDQIKRELKYMNMMKKGDGSKSKNENDVKWVKWTKLQLMQNKWNRESITQQNDNRVDILNM